MRKVPCLLSFATLLAAGQPARAGEVTRVASAFEEGNPIDLHTSLAYDFQFKRAAILREWGVGGHTRLGKDLIYQQYRHVITPSLELGLFRDLSVYLTLPVIVSDDRNYAFDQEAGTDCVFPDDVTMAGTSTATCVDKTNSSTLRDGILPANGFDALSENAPYSQYTSDGAHTIFRGPNRRGVDQLHVGIKYGILNQKRYPFPNWVFALEGRFAVGRAMKFTRDLDDAPASNHSVGRKIHELGMWTALSRRFSFLEPYFGAFWRFGLRAAGSEFRKYATSAQRTFQPQSHGGVYIGTEIVPWDRPAQHMKFALLLSGSAEIHYNGRAYSEIWELLSDSPALVGTPNPGRTRCNVTASVAYATENPDDATGYITAANAASNSGGCQKFNGLTTVQDFGSFGLNATGAFHLGPYARFHVGVDLKTDTRHFLTAESRGDPSLTGNPNTVEPDSIDVNPLRRDVVDNVGRRYAIDDVVSLTTYAHLILMF